VNADTMFDTLAQRLRRDLGIPMEEQGIDTTNGMFALRLVARPHHQAIAAATHLGPLGDHVQRGTIPIRWK
jgi:hypothetical protein